MLPVVLVKLPNAPQFVGTFDPNFEDWWLSEPLPGYVDEIIDSTWVYGQYHVCYAKMMDGTYTVYRSGDYGVHWVPVRNFNTKIYTMKRIDFGRVLISTGNGWYRSNNSGGSWTLVSTSAPQCHTVAEVGRDRLVAINNTSIFYSPNAGSTWEGEVWEFYYKGRSWCIPAATRSVIDGNNGIVFCRYNDNTIIYSQDFGANYTKGGFYNNRLVDTWNKSLRYSGTITRIICTGTYNGFPTFVIQQDIGNNTLRHYYAFTTTGTGYTFSARFDAKASPDTDLTAKEILAVGTSTFIRSVVFVGAHSNGSPRVVVSTDGGYEWEDAPISQATIYTGPDLSQVVTGGGPFVEDSYISKAWSGPICHNWGAWVESGYMQMGLSYEMDLNLVRWRKMYLPYTADILIATRHPKPYLMDILNKKGVNKLYLMDVLQRKIEPKTYLMDILNQIMYDKTYTMDILNQMMHDKTYTMDILNEMTHDVGKYFQMYLQKTCDALHGMEMELVLRFYLNSTFDAHVLKTCQLGLITDILNQKRDLTSSHSMDMKIQGTIVQDILHRTEIRSPQFPDMGKDFEVRSYNPIDSREEILE